MLKLSLEELMASLEALDLYITIKDDQDDLLNVEAAIAAHNTILKEIQATSSLGANRASWWHIALSCPLTFSGTKRRVITLILGKNKRGEPSAPSRSRADD
jgi:hypothetical protein